MRHQILTAPEAVDMLQDGMSIMFGGFMGCGNPHTLVDALIAKGIKDITLIANDTCRPEYGIGKLVVNGQVKKVIASHIGLNPVSGQLMNAGTMEVELIPQGTLAEQIRSAGAGLGGFLTPTGVGTPVEQGKQRLTINGRDYLLELPLRANVALINAKWGDTAGNLVYNQSAQNFNPLMAMAADLVIAEVDEIVEAGTLDPNHIHTPGIFVDYLVQSQKQSHAV